MTNLANLGQANKHITSNVSSNHSNNYNYNSINENNYLHGNGAPLNSNNHLSSFSNSSSSANVASANKFVFLFTSDFERNAWLEEINGAIYACKQFCCILPCESKN
jgi:hypothetical protein